ncbi:MAG TPA: hypothetical protein EYP80_01090 [Candidatus Aenigmarchaeota archaeon]|nr:hypothetical protein [Candidatus Aenigmarchaeota archaeon]
MAGDFHISERANEIPKKLISQKTDYFICTGNLTSENVLKKLNKFKNLVVVRGNCNYLNLPEYKEIEINNKSIGVVHSHQFGRGKYL